MKLSIWDILSFILFLGIILILATIATIFNNPNAAINPFKPATPAPVVFVPSSTLTSANLPPTWTPEAGVGPTLAPTSTRSPTTTPFPTRTPFILPSPSPAPKATLPSSDHLPLDGKCTVAKQSPTDGTSFKPGTEFTTSWTLENTSESTWDRGSTDLKFKAGDAMYKNTGIADLPVSVGPGKSVDITVTMIAPATPGYHITYWTMVSGSTVLCTFYVEINVAQ